MGSNQYAGLNFDHPIEEPPGQAHMPDDLAAVPHTADTQLFAPADQAEIEKSFYEQKEALTAAHIDKLTGLPNRDALDAELDSRWGVRDSQPDYIPESARANRDPATVEHRAIIVRLDMAELKILNGIGNAVGDEALRRFAEELRAVTRPGDILARQGGDDFVVIVPLANELSDEQAELMRLGIETRLRTHFSSKQFVDDQNKVDPTLRIKLAQDENEAFQRRLAEYEAAKDRGEAMGSAPSRKDMELYPMASVGSVVATLIEPNDDLSADPGAANRRYHAAFHEVVEREHAHKEHMVEAKILNPRPTPVVDTTK